MINKKNYLQEKLILIHVLVACNAYSKLLSLTTAKEKYYGSIIKS